MYASNGFLSLVENCRFLDSGFRIVNDAVRRISCFVSINILGPAAWLRDKDRLRVNQLSLRYRPDLLFYNIFQRAILWFIPAKLKLKVRYGTHS